MKKITLITTFIILTSCMSKQDKYEMKIEKLKQDTTFAREMQELKELVKEVDSLRLITY